MRWFGLVLCIACSNPTGEVCDDHVPSQTRALEIGNLDRSVPLGTEFPFVPYEDGEVVLKEFGSQAATHLPVFLRVEARPEDGDALRCAYIDYSREPDGFTNSFPLELERRGDAWVTRLGFQDVAALGNVVVRVTLRDAVFEGTSSIALEAVEPIM